MKKLISALLVLAMVFALMPTLALIGSAEGEGPIILPGDCFHSRLSYTDNQDGETHTVTCLDCSAVINASQAHTFSNGVCTLCGAEESAAGPIYASDLVFASKSLSLKSYTAFDCIARNKVLNNYDSYYVVFERYDYANGTTDTITTVGEPYNGGTTYTLFRYKVMSYMMADSITATLYGVKDGVTYYGEVYTSSVREYSLSKLPSATEAMKSVYANLLNYGAKAQIYLSYNTSNLANDGASAYASYVPTTVPATTNESAATSDGYTSVGLATRALGLNASVEVQFALKKNMPYDKSELYAVYTYQHDGETVSGTIDGNDWGLVSGYPAIKVDALWATEGRVPVSVTIYTKSGDTRVSETWTYSIQSHIALKCTGDVANFTAQQNVLMALMNYYDACSAAY